MNRGARWSLVCLALVILFSVHGVAGARPAGATLTVDTNSDAVLSDGELSLREAIQLASGELDSCMSTHEKNQVSGASWLYEPPSIDCEYNPLSESRWHVNDCNLCSPGLGANDADSIVFTSNVSTINASAPMSNVGRNDNIDGGGGSGGRVALNGTSAGSGDGLQVSYCVDCSTTTSNKFVNLLIYKFPGAGVRIDGQHADGVILQGLEIHDNGGDGIHITMAPAYRLYNPRNTQIGGASAGQRNFIYANGGSGIVFIGMTDNDTGSNFNNRVENNYIGVKPDGNAKSANGGHGIYLQDMLGNTIIGNVVSGNSLDGIKLAGSGSDYNAVKGNTIGLNAAQSAGRGNTYNGVTLASGAQHNVIGGSASGEGNVIAGNGLHGIGMYDANTNANGVYSNTIGTNSLSAGGLGNGGEGVHLENGPSSNVIGQSGGGNLISGNAHDGVQLGGSGTNNNLVYNNTIGLSANRAISLPNGYSGVAIAGGASSNLVGFSGGNGNVIAGNSTWGIYIAGAGTSDNSIYANFIGTNPAGAGGLGNGYDGIVIGNGAANNTAGDLSSAAFANTIAGNGGVGIAIDGAGTSGNAVLGNFIGWVDILTPRPNAMGVRLTGGATYNTISGNFIGGNTAHGAGLYNSGTMSNTVQLNVIGGTILAPMGNGMNGIVIQESASANLIDQNLIISNGENGVYVNSAGTKNNVISNNRIGTNSGGSNLGNAGRGVLFDNGATNNSVLSGTIAYNHGGGIGALPGSNLNSFLRLNAYGNDGLGIDLLTPAGAGCTSGAAGGNLCDPPPVISYAAASQMRGSAAYFGARIDVYVSDGDPSGSGEGRYWLTSVTTDGAGKWAASWAGNICAIYGTTAKVTATTTSSKGGTSEFARNFPACYKSFLPLMVK